ncbi:Na+/H+ antiporter nhaA [Roseomonas mucosa]|uniref:Na(+)/H(+) antiporter NhaA n=1 Tax=Roseomonas mucosa TaxID=207340 RepID=A0A4Y1MTC1_9PROT|nr:Na+/H+ antiporter nhaA [Roseomonas mucosa]
MPKIPPRLHGKLRARAHYSRFAHHYFQNIAPLFFAPEVAGGPLLIATAVAILAMNSPWAEAYAAFWQTPLALSFGGAELRYSLAEWANEALLPIFFFGIGVEVKRELTKGLLSERATAAFPFFGAVGGLLVPVLIYLAFNLGGEGQGGWGIPVTMDTAFALGILGFAGHSMPRILRVLLMAFSAVDDVGGLLVIAFAYTPDVQLWPLLGALLAYGAVLGLIRTGVISSVPYVLLGLVVWFLMQQAHVHATLAGVALGFLVPTVPRVSSGSFAHKVRHPLRLFRRARRQMESDSQERKQEGHEDAARALGTLSELSDATYEAAERVLAIASPWITFVVLPLFALSNAGIAISPDLLRDAVASPVALGIVAGLLLGKPVGFLGATWLACRAGLARLPEATSWGMIAALGILAGIGFTVSLFISHLAFGGTRHEELARIAVLASSVVAGLLGYVTLRWALASGKDTGAGENPDRAEEPGRAKAPRRRRVRGAGTQQNEHTPG